MDYNLSSLGGLNKARGRRPRWILFALGLVFTLGGVAVLGFGWYEDGYPGIWVSIAILATFGGVGGLFFWVPIALKRSWDAPKTFRVNESGFGIGFESGREVRHTWDENDLVISIREPLPDGPLPARPPGDDIILLPGFDACTITREASDALVNEANRHGLSYLEERYRSRLPSNPDQPVSLVSRTFARLPFGVAPPAEGWPLPEPPQAAGVPSQTSFELAKGQYDAHALGLDKPVKAGTLTIEPTGIRVALTNNREQRYEFSDPKVRIRLGGRLASSVTPLDAPRGLWHISFRATDSGLFLSGAARTAIVNAAQAHGLEVSSSRIPVPDRPVWRWVSETYIRPSSPARRVALESSAGSG